MTYNNSGEGEYTEVLTTMSDKKLGVKGFCILHVFTTFIAMIKYVISYFNLLSYAVFNLH